MPQSKFYITTPIYYANDKPHVGHAYTTVAADVLARYWREKLGKDNVFFLTGTDEHGQKIAEAAERSGQQPDQFVDSLMPAFQERFAALNVSNDIFMRTTKRGHIKFAQEFLAELKARGYIYKGEYEGIYCVGDEAYIAESDLVDGKCPHHPNLTPEKRQEENYFFKFTEFAPRIKELIESGELEVRPEARRNEVLARLGGDLHDLSISRPGLEWGVPVPWDDSHTMYVWVEALLNYASALEIESLPSLWPPDVQLMAKDILWFHAAIWPALLLANERTLPKTIFAHGFFTIDGQKMSKTLGNVIDPAELVEEYGSDATRYFLLSAVPFGNDGDLAASRFAEIYEADLANGLGNLLNRTVTMLNRAELKLATKPTSFTEVEQAIENLEFDKGLKLIWDVVREANKDLEVAEPWKLIKDTENREQLEQVLGRAFGQLEKIAAGLKVYLPETSAKIVHQLETGKAESLFPRQ
ncbi:methionine--tRNA ligase [Candidatus Berkelbacteria bacterium]|nr:methionine--tRNA ligase [Candidatus Berkelbacteria bacterium]